MNFTNSLPSRQTYDDWRLANFGSTTSDNGGPEVDPDGDGADNATEFLWGTAPLIASSRTFPQMTALSGLATLSLSLPANRSVWVETSTNLLNWTLWDVPGNGGLPTTGSPVSLSAPATESMRFFLITVREN
ncbi:MAG TPA: hypothetical protein VK968_13685, partial [Roseimicrobium sp.]|nr:hypothetical protein [Roseimicrobium sp.]